jgi:hypothetical protein
MVIFAAWYDIVFAQEWQRNNNTGLLLPKHQCNHVWNHPSLSSASFALDLILLLPWVNLGCWIPFTVVT